MKMCRRFASSLQSASNVAEIRRAVSKKRMGLPSIKSCLSRLSRACARAGMNPTNLTSWAERGDTDKAAVIADGPGIGTTRTFRSQRDLTRSNPGSQMSGVPASGTRATSLPLRSSSRTRAVILFSLCSCKEIRLFAGMLRALKSFRQRLVSSHAIASTVSRTDIARSLISWRFPIGVATTYTIP